MPPERRSDAIQYSLKRLQKAYALGVRTIVDVSPSVDVRLLREVVEQTHMHVVACTGYYVGHNGIYDTLTVEDFLSHSMDAQERYS